MLSEIWRERRDGRLSRRRSKSRSSACNGQMIWGRIVLARNENEYANDLYASAAIVRYKNHACLRRPRRTVKVFKNVRRQRENNRRTQITVAVVGPLSNICASLFIVTSAARSASIEINFSVSVPRKGHKFPNSKRGMFSLSPGQRNVSLSSRSRLSEPPSREFRMGKPYEKQLLSILVKPPFVRKFSESGRIPANSSLNG